MTRSPMTPPERTPLPPRFTAVAAIARNGVIGANGDLVWRSRMDMQRLKGLTMGHTLVMGRKNYDSIGRALPGRRTVVITRQLDWTADGVTVVHDAEGELDAALCAIVAATADPTVVVFGGGEIYAQLWDRCEAMEITEIQQDIDGDTHFPTIDPDVWNEVSRERHDGFDWVRYERRNGPPRTAPSAT